MMARNRRHRVGTRCAIITAIAAISRRPTGKTTQHVTVECMHENENGVIYHCPDCGWKGPKERVAEEDDWRCPVCGSLFEAEPVEPTDD
jgi:predicted RNA-binding Zn-ribbon protein involved in translation (DUF1610 family)